MPKRGITVMGDSRVLLGAERRIQVTFVFNHEEDLLVAFVLASAGASADLCADAPSEEAQCGGEGMPLLRIGGGFDGRFNESDFEEHTSVVGPDSHGTFPPGRTSPRSAGQHSWAQVGVLARA